MATNSSRYHMATLKIVLVGSEAVGKTSLLIRFHQNTFPDLYVPTVFDSYWKEVLVDGNEYGLLLWDNSGNEDYTRLRPLSYPQTDVFLVCFDINNRESFIQLQNLWLPEVKRYQNGTPIIIVGNKMDVRSESLADASSRDFVLHVEGVRLALREGAIYCESSAKENRGVQEIFQTAVRYYIHQQPSRTSVGCFGLRQNRRSPNIPFLPPPCPLPVLALEPSLFSKNMKKLLSNPECGTDVTFIFSDKTQMEAHRLVLCCTSNMFRRIFLRNTALNKLNAVQSQRNLGGKLTSRDINCGRVCGLFLVKSNKDVPYDCVHFEEPQTIFLTLSDHVSKNAFNEMLTFMYTGKLNFSIECDAQLTSSVLEVVKIFQVDVLEDYLKGEHELTENGLLENWKKEFCFFSNELFCNTSRFADMSFRVEGQVVRSHFCMLVAHCDFMSAMLSGNFQESSQKEISLPSIFLDGFLGFLQYIYTDDVDFQRHDPIEVMKVANQFCCPRLLTLCEINLEKKMESSLASCKKKSEKLGELIELITTSQTHNAHQLVSKYLYYIAINFEEFKKRKELESLSTDNLIVIEQQRWPPPCYLTELNAYRKTRDRNFSCSIM